MIISGYHFHSKIAALFLVLLAQPLFAGPPPEIRLEGAWDASAPDILKVLQSAANPLWRQFPDRDLSPVNVHAKGGPITLFARDKDGGYIVKLDTGGMFWAQHAYQFSHEFCHILCNYREGGDRNKWFEESLCELASIYTLRKMASTWQTDPPYPNWSGYGEKLRSYAQDLIDETKLPDNFPDWWAANRGKLTKRADDRKLNRVVAVRLLPIFEKHPELWGAVAYVNRGPDRNSRDFPEYMQSWYDQAPRHFGGEIAAIAALFGIAVK